MKYKLNDIFNSIQGEGRYTGTPCTFIRFSGCNLSCPFCDTDVSTKFEMDVDDILKKVKYFTVVLTGGEPTLQQLDPLVHALRGDHNIHIETNGTTFLPEHLDWVSISPKTRELCYDTIILADEIKFLCGVQNWEAYIDWFLGRYGGLVSAFVEYHLMPVARPFNSPEEDKLLYDNIKLAYDYCMRNPEFNLCLQVHKFVNLKFINIK